MQLLNLVTRRAKSTRTARPFVWMAGFLPLLLTLACAKGPAGPTAAPTLSVKVVKVEARSLDETIDISGSLVSSVAVDVKTEIAGRIVALRKLEGDRVSQGELLAELNSETPRLAVAQAHANLEVAQASLDRARILEDHARLERERAENLLRSGGITDKDYRSAQVAARDATAQVKLAAAQVEQMQEALALAEKNLRDTRMLSPITGEVERKYVNVGIYLDRFVMVYRLVDNRRLELETSVASSQMARLAKGQTIRFSVATFPGVEFSASILTLSPAVQMDNRTMSVRGTVPNPEGRLKAGMFVKGRIIVGTNPSAIVVPPSAAWRRVDQPPFVYVVEANRAKRREVKLGVESPETLEITGGLRPGDTVIAEQYLELADGVRVVPRP
jgi:membrane fusion protein (multidrug efflux system)